jgi:predicted amidohydrolase YtcJ
MDKSIDIVVKGNVITMANQQPRAEAIGIKGEKIVSVSSLK